MLVALPAVGEVHVRRFDLDQEKSRPELLSEDEKARAGRFHFERDANRWAAGRSLLRRALGEYLDTAPESLPFETGPWGKPGLRDCPVRFNVSHSGACLLLAFAWQHEVGIDVERTRCDFAPEELAGQVFSAKEQAWLRDCPPGRRHQAFLTLWTAKEAYVKATGKGLSFPLSQLTLIPILETSQFEMQDLSDDGMRSSVSVCRITSGSGCRAALALEGSLTSIQYFDCCHASPN